MSKYRLISWKIISKSVLGLSFLAIPLFTTVKSSNYFQVTAQESRPRVTSEEIVEQTQKLIRKIDKITPAEVNLSDPEVDINPYNP